MSIENLVEIVRAKGIECQTDMPMAPLSSFKIGGSCALAIFPSDRDQLAYAVREAIKEDVKYTVVGKASNVLFSDDGYDGMVIFMYHMNCIYDKENTIFAEAGVPLGLLASYAMKQSLTGLEFTYGIPGSVGGALFMNAGAYGGEMSDVTVTSEYYDPITDTFGSFTGDEHKFSYRNSIYATRKELIILGGAFELEDGDQDEIRELMNENMRKRRDSQPIECPSAGSAFKRPKDGYAAQMIDECGLKGFSIGDAAISEKHAGFIINKGDATSEDVKRLMEEVRTRVYNKFGVMLENEIKYIEN